MLYINTLSRHSLKVIHDLKYNSLTFDLQDKCANFPLLQCVTVTFHTITKYVSIIKYVTLVIKQRNTCPQYFWHIVLSLQRRHLRFSNFYFRHMKQSTFINSYLYAHVVLRLSLEIYVKSTKIQLICDFKCFLPSRYRSYSVPELKLGYMKQVTGRGDKVATRTSSVVINFAMCLYSKFTLMI